MSIRANVDRARLNERVQFQRATDTRAANGDWSTSWQALGGPCWAAVDGQKASDRNREPDPAGAILTAGEYVIWVRADIVKRKGLQAKDRALWRGRVFDIKDIPDQQLRGRLMAVICQVGKNDG
jgi:head-tail adaptor